MTRHDLIAIGGSTGSTVALRRILADLPPDLPASILITTHLSSNGQGLLVPVLARVSRLPVIEAVDRSPIEPGRVYVAVPNRHLLVRDDMIVLGDGPRENMVRPAIDALFRSVALAAGSRAIGVVLSGLLSDGAAGLHAIKTRGGLAVVQSPDDAEAGSMPRAAIEAADLDHVEPAASLGALLARLVSQEAAPPPPATPELELEVQIAAGSRLGSDRLRLIAKPAALTCPHCQGVLSEVETNGPLRFRCQVGHAFTAEALAETTEDDVGQALFVAMRVLEERIELVDRMTTDARERGRRAVAELYEGRGAEYRRYADTLRRAATLSRHLTQEPTVPQPL